MGWMEGHADRRGDPKTLWPEARSVIVLAANYGPAGDPLALQAERDHGAISVYARGDDYHDVLKKKLKRLAREIVATHGRRRESLRRHRAGDGKAAGAGGRVWAGRASTPILSAANTAPGCSWARCSRRWSWNRTRPRPIIAAPAAPASMPAPPTPSPTPIASMRGAAFPISPSSTRDTSPKSSAPPWATASMAATIAWPSARGTNSRMWRGKPNSMRARNCSIRIWPIWRGSTMPAFASCSAPRPIKRIGRDRFIRNVLIAIGNSRRCARWPNEAERLLGDASPLVRAMAVWALSRLTPRHAWRRWPRPMPRRRRRRRADRMARGAGLILPDRRVQFELFDMLARGIGGGAVGRFHDDLAPIGARALAVAGIEFHGPAFDQRLVIIGLEPQGPIDIGRAPRLAWPSARRALARST